MALRTTHERVYERILCYGIEGSGKTRNWLDIARMAQKTGSDAEFHVIDTDYAVPRMMTGEAFKDLSNVKDVQVDDWVTLMAEVNRIRDIARPHDWIVIDMLSWAWQWIQDLYIEKQYHQTTGEKWMSWATAGTKGGLLEGDRDWGTINKNYGELGGALMRMQCHVFCTAAAKAVSTRDAAEIQNQYGRHGVKPEGQKNTGNLFQTVLLCRNTGLNEWRITTVKDRERAQIEGEVVKSFSLDYLIKRAGWRP